MRHASGSAQTADLQSLEIYARIVIPDPVPRMRKLLCIYCKGVYAGPTWTVTEGKLDDVKMRVKTYVKLAAKELNW